jgi:peptidyl-prolyl cis-trans isomerase SurA
MYHLLLLLLLTPFLISSNLKDKTLFTIDNDKILSKEFINVYKKNLNIIDEKEQKDLDNYLQLYIDYKLKILDAYEKDYDKNPKYINELNNYSNQLASNYLYDKKSQEFLLNEAYERTQKEIKVSHILIRLDPEESDTLDVYNKLLKYSDDFKSMDLNYLKKKYHDGENIFVEDLGYFSAFKMIYSFESVAYNTEIGSISKPFRTRFGYHILKVLDKRNSLGQVTVGHIMLSKSNKDSKSKIYQLKDSLNNGADFEFFAKRYSEDKNSSLKGGKLKPFTSGQLNSIPFENMAFSLDNTNEISEPVETKFGWHILKLYSKSNLKSFEMMKEELLKKINNNSRSKFITDSFYKKLLDKYHLTYNINLDYFDKNMFDNDENILLEIPENFEKNKILLYIKENPLTYIDFANFLINHKSDKKIKKKNLNNLFINFLNLSLVTFYKNNLETENLEYAQIYNEYKEGLLLFDLMENEVWNKAKNDTIGLRLFYNENKNLFLDRNNNYKSFDNIKGEVITKYQSYIENKWISNLRKKKKIKINRKVFKNIKREFSYD